MVTPDVRTQPGFLDAFCAAWNAHDVDALMRFMAEDCEWRYPTGPEPCGERHAGRASVRAAFSRFFERVHDARWSGNRNFVCGERGLSLWRMTGDRQDGVRLDVDGVDVLVFRDGLIASMDTYLKNRVPAGPA